MEYNPRDNYWTKSGFERWKQDFAKAHNSEPVEFSFDFNTAPPETVWQSVGSPKVDRFHIAGRPINTSIFEEAEVVV